MDHSFCMKGRSRLTEAAVLSAIRSIKLRMKNDPQLFLRHYNKIEDEEHERWTFRDPGQESNMLYGSTKARKSILSVPETSK